MHLKHLLLILSSAMPAMGSIPADLMSRILLDQTDFELPESGCEYEGSVAQRTKTGATETIIEARSIYEPPQDLFEREACTRVVQSIYKRANIAKSTPYGIVIVLTRIEMARTLSKSKMEDHHIRGAQGLSAATGSS